LRRWQDSPHEPALSHPFLTFTGRETPGLARKREHKPNAQLFGTGKIFVKVQLAVLSFTALFISVVLADTAQADFTGRVVGITDGDTVRVMRDGEAVKTWLHGIDAPESRQAFGSRSKQFLSAVIAGKTVTVVEHDTDRHGRIVGEIICDGANVNHASVDAGMAWWYHKYAPNDSALDAAEQRAKSARRGLWSDANPTPPWEYCRGVR